MAYWNGTTWVPETAAGPSARRTHRGRLLGAATEASLIVLLAFGLIAGTTFAAKGGNGGKGNAGGNRTIASVALVVLDGADAVANHGERVTFDVTTDATDRPFVSLKCWQGATGVYNASIGVFDSYLFDPWLTLDSSYWTDGVEASCTARAYHYDKRGNQKELATITLTVAP